MNLFDFPESVLFRTLSLLSVEDLLLLAQTDKAAKRRLYNDESLWRDRCRESGVNDLEGWGVATYRQLFLGLLYPSRQLMGLWFTPDTACGSLLYVSLRCPVVLGCAVMCPDLTGPAWLRPVFQISCQKKRLKHSPVQCLGSDLLCTKQTEHSALLTYINTGSSPKLVLGCELGCNHAELDFVLWLCNPTLQMFAHSEGVPPQETSRIATQEPSQPDRRTLLASCLLMQRQGISVLDGLASSYRPSRPSQCYQKVPTICSEHALEGLWRGLYGAYAVEFINVRVLDGKLCATKLTGDLSVPAGQVSFEVDMHENSAPSHSTFLLPKSFRNADGQQDSPVEIKVQEQYFGQGQIAQVGYVWPTWTPVQLLVFSKDNFGLLWESLQSFTMFTRLPLQL